MSALILDMHLRSAALLGMLLLGLRLLPSASPAVRHRLLVTALAAHVLFPLVSIWPVPGLELPITLDSAAAAATAAASDGQPEVAGAVSSSVARAAVPAGSGGVLAQVRGWLFALWIVGFVILACRLARSHWSVRRLIGRGRRTIDAGVPPGIETVESAQVAAPFAYGLRRLAIVLPNDWRRWSTDSRRNILGHELAHVRRCDPLQTAGAELIAAVYWLNPLVWLALRRLRLESERAADEAVLAEGADPRGYADDLLGSAHRVDRGLASAAGVGLAAPRELEVRVRSILRGGIRRADPRVSMRLVVPLLILVAVVGTLRVGAAETLLEGTWLRVADDTLELVDGRVVRVTGWGVLEMPRGAGSFVVSDGDAVQLVDGSYSRGSEVHGHGAVLLRSADDRSLWRFEPVAELPSGSGTRTRFDGPSTGHTRYEQRPGGTLTVYLRLDGDELVSFIPAPPR